MKNNATDIFARIQPKITAALPARELVARLDDSPLLAAFIAVDVGPAGIMFPVRWNPALGATRAEVDRASISLAPAVLAEPMQVAAVALSGDEHTLSIPAGKRLKAIRLDGLETTDSAGIALPLTSHANLSGDRRLTISPYNAGQVGPPLFAIPAVRADGQLPASLRGASFDGSVVTLLDPGLDARRVRVTIVSGGAPQDFSLQSMKLRTASIATHVWPRDLTLTAPDGSTLWKMPGEWNPDSPGAEVDLRVPLKTAIEKWLNDGRTGVIDLALSVKSSNACRASVKLSAVKGSLVRTFSGVTRVTLAGEPAPLVFADPLPLANETPSTAHADVAIRYDGLRVLSFASDDPVAARAEVSGVVITDQQVFRPLHHDVGMELSGGKIGLIGRAAAGTTCELSVQVHAQAAGQAPVAIADPSILTLEPDLTLRTRWVDVPELRSTRDPLTLSVRANRGTFYWAMREAPLVRLAVRDPDPGGREVRLGGRAWARVNTGTIPVAGQSLPGAAFVGAAGASMPMLESELFLTVDLSDLTLRYAR